MLIKFVDDSKQGRSWLTVDGKVRIQEGLDRRERWAESTNEIP